MIYCVKISTNEVIGSSVNVGEIMITQSLVRALGVIFDQLYKLLMLTYKSYYNIAPSY